MAKILIIDDDDHVLSSLKRSLTFGGHEVAVQNNPSQALVDLERFDPDIVLLDVRMPISGLELIKPIKQRNPDVEVIVMTGYGTIDMAVQAVKDGAFDFLGKPFDHPDALTIKIDRAVERRMLRRKARDLENGRPLDVPFVMGGSKQMADVMRVVGQVAPTHNTVLITGETGTGKEMIARAIHRYSDRVAKPFLAVNCSALSEQLIESELFGHEKGSFTGALGRRDGFFIEAHGGTLFLDEIGEMPHNLQAKLLRVLQEGEVRRVGSNLPVKVDVRVIAATNRALQHEVRAGRFREDLFYRLNVVNIHLAPLRERRQDIAVLAGHFLAKHQAGVPAESRKRLTTMALELVERYAWPGNVRELENAIQRALVLSETEFIHAQALPVALLDQVQTDEQPMSMRIDLDYQAAKHAFVEKFDRTYVRSLLERFDNHLSRCAAHAGMDRSNFRKLVLKTGARIEGAASEKPVTEEEGELQS